MSFYTDFFYGEGFYGEVVTGGIDVPVELAFYRTNTDGVYVFHWGFQEAFINPNLLSPSFDFDLQIDTVTTFDSGNLQQYDKSTALTYQNGAVRKGAAIAVNPRLDKTEQTWYWRVRTKVGINVSNWSSISQFTILEKFRVQEAENLLNNLPDYHVYGKEDLRRAVVDRASKLYKICDMYGSELDQTKLEDILTATNNYVALCRDEQLYDNFGFSFNYPKPQVQTSVEYRNTLRNLLLGSLTGGTFDAIRRVVKSFTGVTPVLGTIKDREDFFLSTILETPPEAPDGSRHFFSTSSEFIPGTLVVLLNGVALDPGYYTVYENPTDPLNPANTPTRDDYVEDQFAPGFKMTVPPGPSDVLTACFDIGARIDPTPVVLDITDRVALTGTVTFTHGDIDVTGVGTLFTTELHRGDFITDSTGLAFGIVDTVISDTALTLQFIWVGDTGSTPYFKLNYNSVQHLSGIVTFTNGSTAVSGVNTNFQTELIPGDTIMDDYGVTGIVQSITDGSNLVLRSAWTGSHPIDVNYPLVTTPYPNVHTNKLVYDDMPLWSKASLANGLIIQVLNPGLFDLPKPLLEMLVKILIPAHVLVFFEYVN